MRLEELETAYRECLVQLAVSLGVEPSEDASRNIQVATWYLVELTKRWAGQKRYGQPVAIQKAIRKSEKEVSRRLRDLDAAAMQDALVFLEGVMNGREQQLAVAGGASEAPEGSGLDNDNLRRGDSPVHDEREGGSGVPGDAELRSSGADRSDVSETPGERPDSNDSSEEVARPLNEKAQAFLESEKLK